MPDVFTVAKRSSVMAQIRGRGNRDTELALAKLLHAAKITGWRRHVAILGKPDFVFRHQRVAVFVDGCFWHGCPKPKHSPMPKGNADFWFRKLSSNRTRDRFVTRTLRAQGWTVIRIWEHELTGGSAVRIVARIKAALPVMLPSRKRSATNRTPVLKTATPIRRNRG
jgi:DNA mismatch endonuclease, patch repair protein